MNEMIQDRAWLKTKTLSTNDQNGKILSSATFSEDMSHRYTLYRYWDDRPKILFVMLNPSTASHNINDATIRRLISFSKYWKAGGFYVGNLWTFRTPNPKELFSQYAQSETVEIVEQNLFYLKEMAKDSACVVYAWGKDGAQFKKDKWLKSNFPDGFHIKLNSDGSPAHPLYLPGTLPLQRGDHVFYGIDIIQRLYV